MLLPTIRFTLPGRYQVPRMAHYLPLVFVLSFGAVGRRGPVQLQWPDTVSAQVAFLSSRAERGIRRCPCIEIPRFARNDSPSLFKVAIREQVVLSGTSLSEQQDQEASHPPSPARGSAHRGCVPTPLWRAPLPPHRTQSPPHSSFRGAKRRGISPSTPACGAERRDSALPSAALRTSPSVAQNHSMGGVRSCCWTARAACVAPGRLRARGGLYAQHCS